jgi:hypothetical protein
VCLGRNWPHVQLVGEIAVLLMHPGVAGFTGDRYNCSSCGQSHGIDSASRARQEMRQQTEHQHVLSCFAMLAGSSCSCLCRRPEKPDCAEFCARSSPESVQAPVLRWQPCTPKLLPQLK